MSVLIAVLVVGVGSLVFRVVPLLAAHWIPDRLTAVAGWGGLGVLAAITVRAVLNHQDAAVPAAPVVAAVSLGVGFLLAFRGKSVLISVGAGGLTYVAIAAALAALS
jgi:branched-subunit amino acid transport protein AzlD